MAYTEFKNTVSHIFEADETTSVIRETVPAEEKKGIRIDG